MRTPWLLGTAVVVAAACGNTHSGGAPDSDLGLDAASTIDAPPPPSLATPANTWTWVEIPGTSCGNGTVTGIGVNRATETENLFVYFEGGGACWDALTCFTEKTAINITTTYDATQFAADAGGAPVDRTPGDPLATATFIWVPYCTGDIHAGDNVMTYGSGSGSDAEIVHHSGSVNTALDIAALHATFPNATSVWVAGSSAGGYGATLNLDRFETAWPSAGVELLQDSAPFVPVVANYATWQSSWKLRFPAGCTDCSTTLPHVIDTLATAYPTTRIGLLTYNDDATVSAYLGYTSSLVPATDALVSTEYAYPNTKAFVVAGTSHTMLGQLGTIVGPGGVKLSDWVDEWATGSAAWATVQP